MDRCSSLFCTIVCRINLFSSFFYIIFLFGWLFKLVLEYNKVEISLEIGWPYQFLIVFYIEIYIQNEWVTWVPLTKIMSINFNFERFTSKIGIMSDKFIDERHCRNTDLF